MRLKITIDFILKLSTDLYGIMNNAELDNAIISDKIDGLIVEISNYGGKDEIEYEEIRGLLKNLENITKKYNLINKKYNDAGGFLNEARISLYKCQNGENIEENVNQLIVKIEGFLEIDFRKFLVPQPPSNLMKVND